MSFQTVRVHYLEFLSFSSLLFIRFLEKIKYFNQMEINLKVKHITRCRCYKKWAEVIKTINRNYNSGYRKFYKSISGFINIRNYNADFV